VAEGLAAFIESFQSSVHKGQRYAAVSTFAPFVVPLCSLKAVSVKVDLSRLEKREASKHLLGCSAICAKQLKVQPGPGCVCLCMVGDVTLKVLF
jgi:hypothetical protein